MTVFATFTAAAFDRATRYRRLIGVASLIAWIAAIYSQLSLTLSSPNPANQAALMLILVLFVVVHLHLAVVRWATHRDWRRAMALVYSSAYLSELRGFPGRDAFTAEVQSEITRARESGLTFTLAVISFDSIEAIRQNQGERVARAAIKDLASRVARVSRPSDLVGYIGEGRLCAILTDCTAEEAQQFVRRLPLEITGSDRENITHRFPVLTRLTQYDLTATDAIDLLLDAERAPLTNAASNRRMAAAS